MDKRRAGTLLLLLAVGVVAGTAYALISRRAPVAPVASTGEQGQGTVLTAPGPGNAPGGAPATPGKPAGVFHLSGRVAGLVPGAASTLTVTVTNPNPYPIRLLTVDTGVTEPAGCPAGSLRVGRYDAATAPAVPVAAHGTAHVKLPVSFADSPTQDQSACAGATFPLAFTGTAVQGR